MPFRDLRRQLDRLGKFCPRQFEIPTLASGKAGMEGSIRFFERREFL